MSKVKIFLVVLVTIILIFVFTSPFLELFAKITGQGTYGGFFGLSGKAYEEGFFISYSFFVTLAMTIFGDKNKYHILAVLLLIIFLIQLGVLESLIISIGAAVIAWLIAQAVLVLKRKIGKK
jgi:hypothetical protein